jgi:hypothetical protein
MGVYIDYVSIHMLHMAKVPLDYPHRSRLHGILFHVVFFDGSQRVRVSEFPSRAAGFYLRRRRLTVVTFVLIPIILVICKIYGAYYRCEAGKAPLRGVDCIAVVPVRVHVIVGGQTDRQVEINVSSMCGTRAFHSWLGIGRTAERGSTHCRDLLGEEHACSVCTRACLLPGAGGSR